MNTNAAGTSEFPVALALQNSGLVRQQLAQAVRAAIGYSYNRAAALIRGRDELRLAMLPFAALADPRGGGLSSTGRLP